MAALLLCLALLAPAVLAESSVLSQMHSSEFTGFIRLLERADLIPVIEASLRSGTAVTIFAPTDEALVRHTSPTLLAFLKLAENKQALKQLLLSHFVAERLSPFKWEGAHATLEGSPMRLNMDAQAFYVNDVAVKQYNALVSGEASVHSLPALIIPSAMAAATMQTVNEATGLRRVLAMTPEAAPAPIDSFPEPKMSAPTVGGEIKAAPAMAVASVASLVAALVAAMLL